jgi:hypothetical protein
MRLEKFTIQKCCGGVSTIYKIDRPIDLDLLSTFVNKLNFLELQHFTKAGIMYVENFDFIITGPIGSNRLQIKCRRANCEPKLNEFEIILKQI